MKSIKLVSILVLVVLAVGLIANAGCRNSIEINIRNIFNDFQSSYKSGNYEALASMLTAKSRTRIENMGDGDFKAGFEKKLEKDKTFMKVLTLADSGAIDRALSGKMNHNPYAFERAVRAARNTANQVESMLKQVKMASGEKKANLEKQIDVKTSEFKASLQKSMSLEGESFVKDAVHAAMQSNASADIVTLRNAIEDALKSTKIVKMKNTGFMRFKIGVGGNYRWEVTKIPNEDKWLINIP